MSSDKQVLPLEKKLQVTYKQTHLRDENQLQYCSNAIVPAGPMIRITQDFNMNKTQNTPSTTVSSHFKNHPS